MNPIHLVSNLLIFAGFYITYRAWRVLLAAQQDCVLAITGSYAKVRHPQYSGFLLVMTGFLLTWPTILTLAMFPVMVVVYIRLARLEERMVRKEFGDLYDRYAQTTPAFIPKFGASRYTQTGT